MTDEKTSWVVEMTAQKAEAGLKAPGERPRVEYRDAKCTGLVLRITRANKRTWYAVYRAERGAGPLSRVRLGSLPLMSLADARDACRKVVADARAGDDMAELRRSDRTAMALAQLAGEYLERHAKKKKTSWKNDEYRICRHLTLGLGARKAREVKRADVVRLVEAIALQAPVEANRVLTLIRRIYSWGVHAGLVDANPATDTEQPGVERKRRRRLDEGELARVWQACSSLRGAGKDAARLMLLTAQRGGEVLSMEWPDLDLEAGLWTIPAGKTKAGRANPDRDDHLVPLPAAAVEILRDRQAKARKRIRGATWVFPGRQSGPDPGHVLKLRRGVEGLRRTAGPHAGIDLPDFRGHDLRRTAASGMGELGIAPHIISRILNHAEGGVTARYNRHEYLAEKRDALERWAAHVLAIVKG